MNKAKALTLAAILAAAMVTFLSAAETAREQALQKGIDLMESKGDLAKAVPLFEDAARSSDRAVAARALLYLGEAQERQGTEKARATYERIVREFSNQTETAAAAQQRLTALGGARPSGALAKRMLCPDCGGNEANFSPDGRLMAFADWDSGDIAIRDMSTEKVRRLLAKIGGFTGSSDAYGREVYAEGPVLSPDLRQVVYLWETGGKDDHYQLRVIQNEPGAKPRVLIDNPEIIYYEPLSWFPDNKSVLVSLKKADKTWQFARVSVSDGSVRALKSLEWRRPSSSGLAQSISPDGQYIVYSALAVNPSKSTPAPADPKDQHLFILAADGSGETEIVKASGINSNPVWTPDGKHILFTSDRSGNVDLWSIAAQNGKAAGAESLVSPTIGNITARGMHGGSYYYEPRRVPTYYVSIAEMKSTREKTQGAGRTAESFVGLSPSWSPDGRFIALKRPHPGASPGTDCDLVVHSLETGAERAYLTSLGTTGAGAAIWFHDGKSLATGIHGAGGAAAFYRIDLKTGDFKVLLGAEGAYAISPDDKTFYAVRQAATPSTAQNLVSIDLRTGQQRQLFTLPGAIVKMKLSPDGRTLAIIQNDPLNPGQRRIARISVDGGDYREVFVSAPAPGGYRIVQGNLGWTSDSRGILFDMRNVEGEPFRIMRVPAEGGEPESTGIEVRHAMQNFDPSPDGSRIAFSGSKLISDLWALDNILTALK